MRPGSTHDHPDPAALARSKEPVPIPDFPSTIPAALLAAQTARLSAVTLRHDRATTIAWSELVARAFHTGECLLRALGSARAAPGVCAVVSLNNGPEVYEITYALHLCRIIPVFLHPKTPLRDLNQVCGQLDVCCCFFDFAQKHKFETLFVGSTTRLFVVGAKQTANPAITPYGDLVAPGNEDNAEQLAQTLRDNAAAAQPTDVCEVVFVPSERGGLKGVVWSYNNVLVQCRRLADAFHLTEKERLLHYLPNGFFMERILALYVALCARFHVFVASPETVKKSARPLFRVAAKVKPTVMLGVPRVFEKVVACLKARRPSSSWAMKKALTGKSSAECGRHKPRGYGYALHRLRRGQQSVGLQHARVLLNCVAPLATQALNDIHSVGLSVYDGLCLAETTGYATVNRYRAFHNYSLGCALGPDTTIRLASDGRVIVEGPTAACGYLEPALNTSFTPTTYTTPFLGRIETVGGADFLFVTGRTTPMVLTKQGEQLYTAPVEAALARIPTVDTALLVGDNERFVACLVLTTYERVLAEFGERAPPQENVGKDPFYGSFLKAGIERINSDLSRGQKIKRFVVVLAPDEAPRATSVCTAAPDAEDARRRELAKTYEHHIRLLFQ